MTSIEIQNLKKEINDLKDLVSNLDAATAKFRELLYLYSLPYSVRSGKCKRGHDLETPDSLKEHGRRSYCKKCIAINRREYYQKNRETILVKQKMRYAGKTK